jgi:HAE1 family hydrophobic/amphiphilic exporter-1
MTALEETATQVLPREMGSAYSGFSYQEKQAPPAGPTFILAIVFVFLLLAAQYDSWKLPWAVLLETPLVALGAFLCVTIAGFDNNGCVQVGLIMLVGLAANNAILNVEFAKARQKAGLSIEEAALDAAKLRFRPILLTTLTNVVGMIPVALNLSGGGELWQPLSVAIIAGLGLGTLVQFFVVPVAYYTFCRGEPRKAPPAEARAAATAPVPAGA